MAEILVRGGKKLYGSINVQGSKNSVLPMIAASMLSRDITIIENCPVIADVKSMLMIFQNAGGKYQMDGHRLMLDTRTIENVPLKQVDTEKLRASILYLGALIGRNEWAAIGYPGGCHIGKRPIDFHLDGFQALGVQVEEGEMITCRGVCLHGAEYTLPYPSVGATENLLLAAATLNGTTILHHAAREPEIVDLAEFLNQMGAQIEGAGTDTIQIKGVEKLHGIQYKLPYDRIVAGTYLFAVAGTGGVICLKNIRRDGRLSNILPVLEQMGGSLYFDQQGLWFSMGDRPKRISITTGPHPEFPTDLQSIAMAVMLCGEEEVRIQETVFESRFLTVEEFKKMGAEIETSIKEVKLKPAKRLYGANLCAKDLRGGAALILAALIAEGKSVITGSEYMERGYEQFVQHLRELGADLIHQEIAG